VAFIMQKYYICGNKITPLPITTQSLKGEDQGGGEQIVTSPPPLAPPTWGGEFNGCHSSPWQAKGHSGMFR
jgi:hypothetical protein